MLGTGFEGTVSYSEIHVRSVRRHFIAKFSGRYINFRVCGIGFRVAGGDLTFRERVAATRERGLRAAFRLLTNRFWIEHGSKGNLPTRRFLSSSYISPLWSACLLSVRACANYACLPACLPACMSVWMAVCVFLLLWVYVFACFLFPRLACLCARIHVWNVCSYRCSEVSDRLLPDRDHRWLEP